METSNNEKRVQRMVIWLDPDVVQRMDSWLHTDNCKNRSEMIGKALVSTLRPHLRTLAATSGWIDAARDARTKVYSPCARLPNPLSAFFQRTDSYSRRVVICVGVAAGRFKC